MNHTVSQDNGYREVHAEVKCLLAVRPVLCCVLKVIPYHVFSSTRSRLRSQGRTFLWRHAQTFSWLATQATSTRGHLHNNEPRVAHAGGKVEGGDKFRVLEVLDIWRSRHGKVIKVLLVRRLAGTRLHPTLYLASRASKPSPVDGFQIAVVRGSPKRVSSWTMTYTVFPSGTARPVTMYTLAYKGG